MIRTPLDQHIAYQVAQGMPEDEALWQQATECLESADPDGSQTLRALQCVAELAERRTGCTVSIRVA